MFRHQAVDFSITFPSVILAPENEVGTCATVIASITETTSVSLTSYLSQVGSLPTIDDPVNPSLITVLLDSSISGGVYTFDVTYTVTNTVDGSSV